jgi:uncharacterized YigZ family protein
MKILLEKNYAELVVRHSRFLGYLFPLQEIQQVRSLLKSLREEHPNATHVVHAFQLGVARSLTGGCSDDGEPSGCAGRPAYDVLRKSNCTNAFLGIVRYFGGVKLGTGGLVKAYSSVAKMTVQHARWEIDHPCWTCELQLEYHEHHALIRLAEKWQGRIEIKDFSRTIHCLVRLPQENQQEFSLRLAELTKGRFLNEVEKTT